MVSLCGRKLTTRELVFHRRHAWFPVDCLITRILTVERFHSAALTDLVYFAAIVAEVESIDAS